MVEILDKIGIFLTGILLGVFINGFIGGEYERGAIDYGNAKIFVRGDKVYPIERALEFTKFEIGDSLVFSHTNDPSYNRPTRDTFVVDSFSYHYSFRGIGYSMKGFGVGITHKEEFLSKLNDKQ